MAPDKRLIPFCFRAIQGVPWFRNLKTGQWSWSVSSAGELTAPGKTLPEFIPMSSNTSIGLRTSPRKETAQSTISDNCGFPLKYTL